MYGTLKEKEKRELSLSLSLSLSHTHREREKEREREDAATSSIDTIYDQFMTWSAIKHAVQNHIPLYRQII